MPLVDRNKRKCIFCGVPGDKARCMQKKHDDFIIPWIKAKISERERRALENRRKSKPIISTASKRAPVQLVESNRKLEIRRHTKILLEDVSKIIAKCGSDAERIGGYACIPVRLFNGSSIIVSVEHEEWIYIKQAFDILILPITLTTFRNWCTSGAYDIVAGHWCNNRVVVKKSTIPTAITPSRTGRKLCGERYGVSTKDNDRYI